jgi:hypothetical protein
MSVRSTPESVVYAHGEIERLAKALVLSWHNDPASNWDPDKRAITFDELIVNHYRCYRCSHQWVDVYPGEPDDICPKCEADVPPYKSHAYMAGDE